MKQLLLDTNALLWILADDPQLGTRARHLVSNLPVRYSSVSVLEVTIKQMLGRLDVPGPVADGAARAGLRELPFRSDHADALRRWPDLVRHDPFDRMLLAQSAVEGAHLLTADRRLMALDGAPVVDARA